MTFGKTSLLDQFMATTSGEEVQKKRTATRKRNKVAKKDQGEGLAPVLTKKALNKARTNRSQPTQGMSGVKVVVPSASSNEIRRNLLATRIVDAVKYDQTPRERHAEKVRNQLLFDLIDKLEAEARAMWFGTHSNSRPTVLIERQERDDAIQNLKAELVTLIHEDAIEEEVTGEETSMSKSMSEILADSVYIEEARNIAAAPSSIHELHELARVSSYSAGQMHGKGAYESEEE